MYDDYRSRGFVALAINLSENMDTVVKLKARAYTFPVVRDINQNAWTQYRIAGYIPLNYVIDPEGIVRYAAEGWNEAAIRNVIETYYPLTHDVGVTKILNIPGYLDSGAVVSPACSVYNYGANTESYSVRLQIGASYDQTVDVAGHAPGSLQYVTFPDWTANARGGNAIICSTRMSGDERPANDRMNASTTVHIYDLELLSILSPVDSVDSGSVVLPLVIARNPGTVGLRGKFKMSVGTIYAESSIVTIPMGRRDTIEFPVWIPGITGTFAIRCTVTSIKDIRPDNDLLEGTVRVVTHTGIAELTPRLRQSVLSARPNPIEGQTRISYSLAQNELVNVSIYGADGRLMRTLFSGSQSAGSYDLVWDGRGDNRVPLTRGVYYCRLKTTTTNAVLKLTKID